MIDLSVSSSPVSLSPQVVVLEDPLGDDEVDGVLESLDIDVTTTPPSSPPVSFLKSFTISERNRIEDRRKNNKTKEKKLKLKYEKMKKNRQ